MDAPLAASSVAAPQPAVARAALWLAMPLVMLAALLAVLLIVRPLDPLTADAPPVETLQVERVRLSPGLIRLSVRADGSAPVRLAQVQVDGAFRTFTIDPPGPIGRLSVARVEIPYPWIAGEKHKVVLIASSGATFEHDIEVAQATPLLDGPTLGLLALVGLLLGVTPVIAGLLAYPGLSALGPGAMRFLLALTVGLLLYLLIDTMAEGLEFAAKALDRLRAPILIWVAAIATTGVLLCLGRRGGRRPEGLTLAAFIALGIGVHNLGEGLAVGGAIAAGEAALATFLVVGFTIHNVSEGVGIATPLVGRQTTLPPFVGLAALAGLPAVPGVWIGAQAPSPLWVALCFGIGAGAILQVIIEVGAVMARRSGPAAILSPAGIGGVVAGLGAMYLTALFV